MLKNVKMSHFLNGAVWEIQNLCLGGKFWTLHWTYSGNDIMINGSDKIHRLSWFEVVFRVKEEWISVSASDWLQVLETTLTKI